MSGTPRLPPPFCRDPPGPARHSPGMATLTAKDLRAGLATVPGWKKQKQIIRRTYPFKDFPAAIKFVNRVARLAEKAWHHPDIDVRWNKVTLSLTTHDAGGLTAKDFDLAARFDRMTP